MSLISHGNGCVIHIFFLDLQPPMPPFPVASKRPDQSSGNHISKVMLDLLEVGIDSATRHMSAATAWLFWLHVGSLSENSILLPALTNCSSVRVTFLTELSGRNCKHLSSKPDIDQLTLLPVVAANEGSANPNRLVSGLILVQVNSDSNNRSMGGLR